MVSAGAAHDAIYLLLSLYGIGLVVGFTRLIGGRR